MKKKLTSMITLVVLSITLAVGSSAFASTFTMFNLTPLQPTGWSGIYTADTGQGFVVVSNSSSSTASVEWVLFNHSTNTVEASGFVPSNSNFSTPFSISSFSTDVSLYAYCGSQANPQPSCTALVELHVY